MAVVASVAAAARNWREGGGGARLICSRGSGCVTSRVARTGTH